MTNDSNITNPSKSAQAESPSLETSPLERFSRIEKEQACTAPMTTTQIQAKESLFTPSSDKEGNNGIRPTPPLVIPMQTLEFQPQQEAG
ncbi:hypothetical protein Bca4012_018711 [Brassica carinata]